VSPVANKLKRPVAAFLGDSYTSGYVEAGIGQAGWPALVGEAYGWRTENLAVPGTGFVNPGWTNQPMRTHIAAVIRLNPGIIFVAAGHNDRRFGSAAAAKAADAVLDQLRAGLPDAILVVIGPIWQDGSPATSVIEIRGHLKARAAVIGALFIDPLRGRWFAGSAHRFIGPDGVHPTDAGHRHIAQLVLASLRADSRFAQAPTPPLTAAAPTPTSVEPEIRPGTAATCPG
jgi:lysophospholipase L1-like esterase